MRKKTTWLVVMMAFIVFMLSACAKKEEDRIACALSVRVLLLNFNVVDAATQQDLYFSNNPRFSIKDIYIFRKEDVSRKDTIKPDVVTEGNNRYFRMVIAYGPENTYILKTGNLTDNSIVTKIGKTEEVCSFYQVEQVTFNGSVVKGNDRGVYTFSR